MLFHRPVEVSGKKKAIPLQWVGSLSVITLKAEQSQTGIGQIGQLLYVLLGQRSLFQIRDLKGYSLSQQGNHGSKSLGWLVTIMSVVRKQIEMDEVFSVLFPFPAVQDVRPWIAATHIQNESSLLGLIRKSLTDDIPRSWFM